MKLNNKNKSLVSRGTDSAAAFTTIGSIALSALIPGAVFAQTTNTNSKSPVTISDVSSNWNHPYGDPTIGAAQRADARASMDGTGQASSAELGSSSTTSTPIVRSAVLPTTATPIMIHIAGMLLAAQAHSTAKGDTPPSARTAYGDAAASLRQALAIGRLRLSSTSALGQRGAPVSSYQLIDDIHQLKRLAMQSKPNSPQAMALTQIAGLYASGAKDFFTGELRSALLSTISPEEIASTGHVNGSATSAEMGSRRRASHNNAAAGGGVIMPNGTLGGSVDGIADPHNSETSNAPGEYIVGGDGYGDAYGGVVIEPASVVGETVTAPVTNAVVAPAATTVTPVPGTPAPR